MPPSLRCSRRNERNARQIPHELRIQWPPAANVRRLRLLDHTKGTFEPHQADEDALQLVLRDGLNIKLRASPLLDPAQAQVHIAEFTAQQAADLAQHCRRRRTPRPGVKYAPARTCAPSDRLRTAVAALAAETCVELREEVYLPQIHRVVLHQLSSRLPKVVLQNHPRDDAWIVVP
jgi:hypothetical protein